MFYLKFIVLFALISIITFAGAVLTAIGILIGRDAEIAAFFVGVNEKLCRDFGFPTDK